MERGRIWVDDVPVPEPQTGEILVRSRACGICGSDLHAARHTHDFVTTSREVGGAFKLTSFDPVILGHEFCAEVLGGGGSDLPPGTLVTSVPMLTRERPVSLGYTTESAGGFAEYMVLSKALCLPVPGATPAHIAALTEPLAVGAHAAAMARLGSRDTALVIGAGPVGLATLLALKRAGVAPVLVSEYSPQRRRLAEQLGADAVIDPSTEDAWHHEAIRRRADVVVFECVGVPGVLDQIFARAPHRARVVVVGVCLETDRVRALGAINKELNVQFVLGYSEEEFAATLNWVADSADQLAALVTHRVALENIAAAFEELATPNAHGKVIVEPG